MNHYTKTKEEKTAELMKRALDFLVHAPEPFELGRETHKKVKFSYGQVLAVMLHNESPQEKMESVAFKDTSTFSHNKAYRELIRDAKEKRAKRLTEDSDLSFGGREPTITELKIKVDRLLYEKESLSKTNKGLESIIRQAGIEKEIEYGQELVSEPLSIDKKLISVLEKLLLMNSKNELFYTERGKGNVPSQLFYQSYDGTTLLCNVNDLKSLNISFDIDKHGKIIIVPKGILNA